MGQLQIQRRWQVPGKWCILSYYTTTPEAPDGSGRILLAGCDLTTRIGAVYVLGPDGKVQQEFGHHPVESSFFHTGFWQTWSPDCRYVYYQGGSLTQPQVIRHELATGTEVAIDGDFEGAPPDGEPVLGCLLGMLYAAGYGYMKYNPALAPVPFEARDKHGVFEYDFATRTRKLRLSVQDFLDMHPEKDRLLELDRELARKNGTPQGLTLMTYCIRWSPDGSRMMIHFGNHCVVKERGEPKVTMIYTCKHDFTDLHLALDLHGGGVHWSFQPDNKKLIGYRVFEQGQQPPLAEVNYDGTGLKRLHLTTRWGGHPSVSPLDPALDVTDDYGSGSIEFWRKTDGKLLAIDYFGNSVPNKPQGCFRNEYRVCHHPVFSRDGRRLHFNVLEDGLAYVAEMAVPEFRE
ncbi:MAG: hypothetical protein IJJ26_10350 [Victivallales bacterium]|nr:hypothetical protein [Victivallales bacterium]